ncbi:hypothetical protein GOP47_0017271 [Adiantum capillus-veneris]|uniref:Uncharacterized protein n=1 Tax=Adiantum capillus-veneris TaxID=13818 RepID=A0A9D4Z909_ADICA|nr:hypothetical protein GOP47_0017271 [Adiantum capillus-veneris]
MLLLLTSQSSQDKVCSTLSLVDNLKSSAQSKFSAGRTKNNPCLVGEAGVGKTAIVEGIAQMIACGADVSQAIAGKRIFTLDMAGLIAGSRARGEFQKRFKKLLDRTLSLVEGRGKEAWMRPTS